MGAGEVWNQPPSPAYWPVLVRPTHGDVSLHRDGEGHVDGGTERDRGHRVEQVDVELWEEGGLWEPDTDHRNGCAAVYGNIRNDVSEIFSSSFEG